MVMLCLDDFVSLNEKFIKARRDYESLLETSMSHPQAAYGRPNTYYNNEPPQNYYSQNPNTSVSPVNHNAYAPPTPSGTPYAPPASGGRYAPPDTQGSSAFYFIPPGGQPPQGPPADYQRPPSRQQHTPAPTAPPADQSQPHELATSVYDTPTAESRPYQAFNGGASAGRPVSPARQPDGAYQPYQRPSYPPQDAPRSPVAPHSPYGAPTAPSAYPSSPGRYHPAQSGGPQDYYRTSEVYLREGQPRS
jgi:signal transducing adaptor molecule